MVVLRIPRQRLGADLFNVQAQVRHQRIQELLEQKTREIEENSSKFDLLVTQRMKERRLTYERAKRDLDRTLDANDWQGLDSVIDDYVEALDVKVPYSSTEQFVQMLNSGQVIVIA